MRLPVLLATMTMAAGCTGGGEERPVPASGDPSLPEWIQSHDIVYGMAGTDSVIPLNLPAPSELTLGTVVLNQSDEHVRIESFEIVESVGVSVSPELIVRGPRAVMFIGSELGWPPAPGRWPVEAERPYGPFDLPPGQDSARWGAAINLRVVYEAGFGYIKGYRIRGTQGGEPFVDVSDTFTAFCVGRDITDRECTEYANEHAYVGFSLPGETPVASTTTATTTAPP